MLTSLQSDTRQDLKDVLGGLATALNSKPSAADDKDADPSARGETAAESFNDAYRDIPAAERSTAQVFEAFLGQEPGEDLSRLIDGAAKTSAALTRNEEQLKDLITNFNTTMAAFASESGNLQTSIRELAPTLETANGTLASLNEAFPPTRAFAREILPGVRETPATIDASFPWVEQTRRLVGPKELGGLAEELSPATRDLAKLTDRAIDLLPETTLTSRCAAPGDPARRRSQDQRRVRVQRRELQGVLVGHGRPRRRVAELRRQRLLRALPARRRLADRVAGLGATAAARCSAPTSPCRSATARSIPASGRRTSPRSPCHTQKLPDVNGPAAAKAAASDRDHTADAMKTAIRKHLHDFLAIIGLIVVAGAVASVILSNQRLTLPGWVPVIGQDFYEIEAELATAQAVTPGQGQTVNVAGVEVGEIKSVKLEDGRAVIGMKIEPKYARVYKDATILLRPKTGLKDMVAELTPGTPAAGRLPEGGRIPVSQTLPDVNLDEILAALDTDTRDYLTLLLNDGGAGAEGQRPPAGQHDPALRADRAPVAEDQRAAGQAQHEHQAARSTTSRCVTEELGSKDDQVADFVVDSNAVFASLASQDAALRATLQELPSSLQVTNTNLGKAQSLADELGPTLQALRPAARALGPTQRKLRPFLRDHDADHPRRAAPVRARLAADGQGAAARDARPRGRHAGPPEDLQERQLRCSTCSPTTRPATRRRATCSGPRGPTTWRRRSSPPRTPTARSATASSCSAARPPASSTRWPTPTRSSARSSTCSTAPTARASARARASEPGTGG